MDDRRDLLIALGWRTLLVVPLVVAGWFLFASTAADADAGGKRLLGLVCVVAAGFIIARPLAGLVAEPTGSLFYPRRMARPKPAYSIADARRTRGQYEEAIAAYDTILERFPAEVRAYIAMMEIAFVNLHDSERADAIVKRALATLRDETSRAELLHAHRVVKLKRVPAVPRTPGSTEANSRETS